MNIIEVDCGSVEASHEPVEASDGSAEAGHGSVEAGVLLSKRVSGLPRWVVIPPKRSTGSRKQAHGSVDAVHGQVEADRASTEAARTPAETVAVLLDRTFALVIRNGDLRSVLQIHFREDAAYVVANSAFAQIGDRRDFSIVEPLGHEARDFIFTFG